MKLLHIVATPRERKSNTLQVADAFLETLRARYPAMKVDVLDLFQSDMPAAAGDNIDTKYTLMAGQPIDRAHQQSWQQIEVLIERFLSADIYLISAPMWNFSIPYALKYYIDCIFQPGYLFRYNELGQAIGLVQDKKMVCVTTRGGDYSPQSPFHAYDFQEPYLPRDIWLCRHSRHALHQRPTHGCDDGVARKRAGSRNCTGPQPGIRHGVGSRSPNRWHDESAGAETRPAISVSVRMKAARLTPVEPSKAGTPAFSTVNRRRRCARRAPASPYRPSTPSPATPSAGPCWAGLFHTD